MAVAERRRRLPAPWLANLLAFGVMFALVVGWFYLQTREAQRLFLVDAGEHARLVADVVALHARGSVVAEEVTDSLFTGFLGSSARFVDYLDGVEPFRDQELTAFAEEIGLQFIRIEREAGFSQGPPDWSLDGPLDCARTGRLLESAFAKSLVYGIPRAGGAGCILVGADRRQFDEIRAAVGLPRTLESVAALPGVLTVALEGEPAATDATAGIDGPTRVSMGTGSDGVPVAEVRVGLSGAQLVLALDAGPLQRMRQRQWRAFSIFSTVLALTGALLSWLLYRHQRHHGQQLQAYERRLSRQREEAGLGRAAAAIAHEIRNPLNALGMGLQRLRIEAGGLDAEHRRLIEVMLEALGRSNDSINGLLDYARPHRLRPELLDPRTLLEDSVSLYRGRMEASGIRLQLDIERGNIIDADPGLLRRVIDNLLRNALEAQPDGGWLSLTLRGGKNGVLLTLTNGGLSLPAAEVQRILDPWFTTRVEGTGLGLAISRRIIEAHGGSLEVQVPTEGELQLRVFLPRNPPPEQMEMP